MIVYRCECGRSESDQSDEADDWTDIQRSNLSGCVGPNAFDCPAVCPVCQAEGREEVEEPVPETVHSPE